MFILEKLKVQMHRLTNC